LLRESELDSRCTTDKRRLPCFDSGRINFPLINFLLKPGRIFSFRYCDAFSFESPYGLGPDGNEMPIIPSRRRTAPIKTGLAIRVDLTSGAQIGPGKVRLLEEIARTGSISAAGRAMNMSFRHAWKLVDGMNETFGPVIATSIGGIGHGGASLTQVGKALVVEYRAIEDAAAAASREHLEALEKDFRG
jgi:molybdate transport system regulatory protein